MNSLQKYQQFTKMMIKINYFILGKIKKDTPKMVPKEERVSNESKFSVKFGTDKVLLHMNYFKELQIYKEKLKETNESLRQVFDEFSDILTKGIHLHA